MALSLTHPFVSGKADDADTTLIRPSNWNAAHTVSGTLDIANGGTGAATAAAARTALGIPATLDFASEVARSASVTLGSGDIGFMHGFTVATLGTNLTVTLPAATSYIGQLLGIRVKAGSAGMLQLKVAATNSNVVGWPDDDFWMWAGESVILGGTSTGWTIIGGVCRPLFLPVTAASNQTLTVGSITTLTGFANATYAGTLWAHGLHALSGGVCVAPRRSSYRIKLDAYVTWATEPTATYATIMSATPTRSYGTNFSNAYFLHAQYETQANTATALSAEISITGGATVITNASIVPPRITVQEVPQW